ncbi:hypothetical protein QR680_010629 [Steinernema hermaphroditum]|uniref:Uncharacterized protein n=1 Tax=Steinernema hermaphroditum TaxID=289476 RepID=A0AA39IR21_9BILA|nr:hypothetical protein QR680_010629 [Steinernema hermaphroditum]
MLNLFETKPDDIIIVLPARGTAGQERDVMTSAAGKYPLASAVISTGNNSLKKTPTYGCCAAWMWLAVIVAIKTLLIVAWITKEYYFFDFTCAVIVNSNNYYDKHSDTVLFRKRRNLIEKASLFRPSALIELHRSKRSVEDIDVWWKKFAEDKPSSPVVVKTNTTSTEKRKKGKKHKKGKKKKDKKKEPHSAEDHARVTKFPEKRFHLLGGADLNFDLGHGTTKPSHQSSWIDGIIDPKDPGFSNKGEIRAYSMKVAKKIPEPDAEMIRNLMKERNATRKEEPLEYSATVPPAVTQPISTLETEVSTLTTETVSPRTAPAVPNTDVASVPPSEESAPKPDAHIVVPRPTTLTSKPPKKAMDEFQPRPLDVVIVKDLAVKTPGTTVTTEQMTTDVAKTPSTTPVPKHKRKENFIVQLNVFTSNALCIGRTMTALWCAAQGAALIPFVLGMCVRVKCLLAPHFILDALFLVVAFIASITITVFSLMLYSIVDEMPTPTLLEWIVFAVVLDVLLVFYTVAFTVSLRCAEIIFDKPPAFPAKSHNYHDNAYYMTSPGSLNGGNEQFV